VPPADAPKPKKSGPTKFSGASGTVSVVGEPKAKRSAFQAADAQYIASVRKQLEKLQGQIEDIDKQLADLKGFSEGEPSNKASGIKLNKVTTANPSRFRFVLQDQKKILNPKSTRCWTKLARKASSRQLR
jgi:hypothetical protein